MRMIMNTTVVACLLFHGLLQAMAIESSIEPRAGVEDAANRTGSGTTPNVVLILSDDQAWTDYSFMGHPKIRTPHLDRLAARSAVFRRGYTPTPLCRPSLMSIITGLYAHQHGVTGNDPARSKDLSDDNYAVLRQQLISRVAERPTLPRLLQEHGYSCLQTGKWWEGNWKAGGFTHGMTRGFPARGGRHGDDGLDIGRKSMQPVFDFIHEATVARRPFFVWYAPMLPHTPHDPPERLLQKYLTDGTPEALAKYYAMCEFFDESCGQLLTHLDEQGLTQQTIVIYVTDNGWIQAIPEMNLGPAWKNGFAPRSKQTPYEGGIRTPILVSWPGVISPSDRPELASTLDVVPTVLDALGIEKPKHLGGISLIGPLKDSEPLDRGILFGESYSHDIADLTDHEVSLQYRWCIQGAWKLILSYESPPDRYAWVHAENDRTPQLFDLTADPQELHNLASVHPELVSQLAERMQEHWFVQKPATGLPR